MLRTAVEFSDQNGQMLTKCDRKISIAYSKIAKFHSKGGIREYTIHKTCVLNDESIASVSGFTITHVRRKFPVFIQLNKVECLEKVGTVRAKDTLCYTIEIDIYWSSYFREQKRKYDFADTTHDTTRISNDVICFGR